MGTPGRARLGVALAFMTSFAASGCAGSAEPQVTISAVTPAAAYSGSKIALVIRGGPFRPIYDISATEGTATVELGAFTALLTPSTGAGLAFPTDAPMWISSSELAATLSGDVTPGVYDVEVRDPRGKSAILRRGFIALGPDEMSPVVTIAEPRDGTLVNPGAEVPIAFDADDGLGLLDSASWTVSTGDVHLPGSCPVAADTHKLTCRGVFVVPQPTQNPQPLALVVTATDKAGNPAARAQVTLGIGLPPVVTSFNPGEGSALGGTLFSVRGQNFIAGTKVLVGGALLEPDGGLLMNDGLIQGTTPAHDPGLAKVTVQTGSASVEAVGSYLFVGRPQVRAISPTSGAPGGCTRVAIVGENFRDGVTSIWFGSEDSVSAALLCPDYVSPNRIEGFVPPGAGVVSVFAGDSVSGVGELPLAFTYLDVDAPDASADAAAPDAATCPCGDDGGAP